MMGRSNTLVSFKIAIKELTRNRWFSLLFTVNLFIGLLGLSVVENLKQSVHHALMSKSKGVLSADLSIGARRKLTDEEEKIISKHLPPDSTVQNMYESFTMLTGPLGSRLVEVKAVDHQYPYYGEIELKNKGVINSRNSTTLFESPKIWIFPELLIQLGLKPNDTIKIAETDFLIDDEILNDSSGIGSGFSFAPPIYVAIPFFEKTGLMGFGSRGYHSKLVKLKDDTKAKELAATLHKELSSPDVRVETADQASEQVGRSLGYLTDYLSLTGLVALFLTAIGQFFLFRTFIVRRYKDIAILRSLGTSSKGIWSIYLFEVSLLSLISITLSLAASSVLYPALIPWISKQLNIPIELNFSAMTIILLLLTGFAGGTLSILPHLAKATGVKAKELFSPLDDGHREPNQKYFLQYFLPSILLFTFLAVYLSNSFKVGFSFVGLLIAAFGTVGGIGFALIKLSNKRNHQGFYSKFIFRQISRQPAAALSLFIVLALATCLTALIPQLARGIKAELDTPQGLDQPSLFLFDIQEEQMSGVESYFKEKDIVPQQASPMIRARLSHVNGEEFMKGKMAGEGITREEENENRFRNRGFNLSYRNVFSKSEKIIKGKPFKGDPNIAEISLETRFADRLKLKMGDVLTFDVQGVPIEGKVTSLRKVRWTSFQPNFFVQFNEGPLNDAPKSYLLTIPKLDSDTKIQIQRDLVKSFPNVSIIDMSRLINRISDMINQITLALQIMSLFTIAVGLLVLYSIQTLQSHTRKKDINLLKVLGMGFSRLRLLTLLEATMIASSAVLVGLFVARALNIILSYQMFEGYFMFSFQDEILIGSAFLTLVAVIVYFTTARILREKPQDLFQSI